jgi:hypothetical protein
LNGSENAYHCEDENKIPRDCDSQFKTLRKKLPLVESKEASEVLIKESGLWGHSLCKELLGSSDTT